MGRKLQNSRIFCVGPSHECVLYSNERAGAIVKTESGTWERRVRVHAFGASRLLRASRVGFLIKKKKKNDCFAVKFMSARALSWRFFGTYLSN